MITELIATVDPVINDLYCTKSGAACYWRVLWAKINVLTPVVQFYQLHSGAVTKSDVKAAFSKSTHNVTFRGIIARG